MGLKQCYTHSGKAEQRAPVVLSDDGYSLLSGHYVHSWSQSVLIAKS